MCRTVPRLRAWSENAGAGAGGALSSCRTNADGCEGCWGGWAGRTIRTQSYGWNADNSPAFPSPAGFNQSFPLPA